MAWPFGVALAVLALLVVWRGPQPDLRPPSAEQTAQAGSLLATVEAFLDDGTPTALPALPPGRWYVTAYPSSGAAAVTVEVQGALQSWAGPLRPAWPARLVVSRELDDAPGPRAGPSGWGLDIGLDGWVEKTGLVHPALEPLRAGWGRAELARFMAEHPGRGLRTHTWTQGPEGPLWLLRDSVEPGPLTPELLRTRISLGADYLVRHLRPDDRYDYEWDVRTAQPRPGYNLIRHAGTTYGLLQAAQVTGNPSHYQAARRALRLLAARRAADSSDPRRCFIVDDGWVKLGASALTLMALVEQARLRPEDADAAWMSCLGSHLVSQLDEEGDFATHYGDGGRYEVSSFRSAYYPGEAALALVRLGELDGEPRWRDAARRAIDFLVHRRYVALGTRLGIPADAWLVQAIAALDRVTPDAARTSYAFAIARGVASDMLSGARVAPDLRGAPAAIPWPNVVMAGARGELLWAATRLERRYRPTEHLFADRLTALCGFTLRHQYTEPILFGLPRPREALGGFRASGIEPVVRIDGVQHNLSALIGLLGLLEGGP